MAVASPMSFMPTTFYAMQDVATTTWFNNMMTPTVWQQNPQSRYALPARIGAQAEGTLGQSQQDYACYSIPSSSAAYSPQKRAYREASIDPPSPAEVLGLLASPVKKSPATLANDSPSPARKSEICPSEARDTTRTSHVRGHSNHNEEYHPDMTQLAGCAKRSKEFNGRLESSELDEKNRLVALVKESVRPLALSEFGTRIVQNALEIANYDNCSQLVKALEPHIDDLIGSPHGNYVVQKIIEVLPSASLTFLVEKLQGKCVSTATHKYGCRVLERLIEHCDEQQLGILVEEIVDDLEKLIVDDFGNFVVQHVIQYYPSTHTAIIQKMQNILPMLLAERHGSYVVEKALEYCDDEHRGILLNCILNASNLAKIACHKSGSHVLEKFANMIDSIESLRELRAQIQEGSKSLSASEMETGKKVLDKLDSLLLIKQEKVAIRSDVTLANDATITSKEM